MQRNALPAAAVVGGAVSLLQRVLDGAEAVEHRDPVGVRRRNFPQQRHAARIERLFHQAAQQRITFPQGGDGYAGLSHIVSPDVQPAADDLIL